MVTSLSLVVASVTFLGTAITRCDASVSDDPLAGFLPTSTLTMTCNVINEKITIVSRLSAYGILEYICYLPYIYIIVDLVCRYL